MTTKETAEEIRGWFAGRLPDEWFSGPAEVSVDGEEILVVGTLAEPDYPEGASDAAVEAARFGRIKAYREETRARRMRIDDEAQHRFGRQVSWGARCGGVERLFTTVNVPVMTRLRMRERKVLDTLIEAGVARSRSEALAWCVRLVGRNEAEWLRDLEDALKSVQKVRTEGPQVI